MVSNLCIEIDNEMSKLRPPVDLLGGFFNLLTSVRRDLVGRGMAYCSRVQHGLVRVRRGLVRVWRGLVGCGVA